MSMDTLPPTNTVLWRALPYPALWIVSYLFLICCEFAITITGFIGTYKLIRAVNKSDAEFSKAKTCGYIMFILSILIWYGGFEIIGSEWFDMWQSKTWNGQPIAMEITNIMIGFLIFYTLPVFKPSGGEKAENAEESGMAEKAEKNAES
ncbi:DUF2165 domain-containing protein [Bifidobacterium sp. ESL0745]|uniref:DUF2165 domain-containing protein n=1 Tax=Bifidobacterium sp. ESL0745 TaxID=2983226 RepID=UPI0023F784F4|nr:DUF2165 domain-containing protein [Bifidobacterium sp. ESL0745]MDF7665490.1 DUF2165 domain-containing protein [Bifidobacterium sp. ESL0745]